MNITFNEMIDKLNKNLKDKKLTSSKKLLENYNGNEWKSFITESKEKYSKSLMYRNHLYDIFVITWQPNQKSLIHDHPDNGCLLKILEGELEEETYTIENNKLKLKDKNIIKKKEISYQEGKNGLHKISNNSNKRSISIHIYSPPKSKMNFYK